MTVKEYVKKHWADLRGIHFYYVLSQLPERYKTPDRYVESYRELMEWYSELPKEEIFGHGRKVEDYPYDENVFEIKS